ncbi:flagellar assembly protein FliH [Aquisediminimonas profunda]|uniref:FliH/SctL family protein n=1 Tax=Aquisediminimonas profunda TaxID=1550733 RepID=UPI001C635429|nr:flagellar assembly protein FliH [Aquisediminimonas profunda]
MSDTDFRSIPVAAAALPRNGFVPSSFARASVHVAGDGAQGHASMDDHSSAVDDYGLGFENGRRASEEAFSVERTALLSLLEKANALRPEPSEELALLIGETVYRLVSDIVGQVNVDRDCLARRANAAAAIVAECDNARTLCVNPEDIKLLDGLETNLTIVGDPSLPRGDLRIDCSAGWIEHGTSLYLEALRSELCLSEPGA